jgi:indole-3-glycerol phosphate synthase
MQVISSNLGTAKTDILISLSGISDITELKEVAKTGLYAELLDFSWYNIPKREKYTN